MPTQERMPTAVVCRQQDVDTAEAATADIEDALAMQRMRYASWMLGQKFGFATAMTNAGFADAETAPLREEVQRWAAMLRLPTPAAPQSQHILNQLSDFGDHLEADPQCIAARLTRRYGSRYGYLYKFGAVVGYGTPARALNVNGAFALQIRTLRSQCRHSAGAVGTDDAGVAGRPARCRCVRKGRRARGAPQ